MNALVPEEFAAFLGDQEIERDAKRDARWVLIAYGHQQLPEIHYVSTFAEVRRALTKLVYGVERDACRRTINGMMDYFTCPDNWFCGALEAIEFERGYIVAFCMRSK